MGMYNADTIIIIIEIYLEMRINSFWWMDNRFSFITKKYVVRNDIFFDMYLHAPSHNAIIRFIKRKREMIKVDDSSIPPLSNGNLNNKTMYNLGEKSIWINQIMF